MNIKKMVEVNWMDGDLNANNYMQEASPKPIASAVHTSTDEV